MHKYDIIVAGDCNIDLIFNHFNKLPNFGEEVLADQFDIALGSSAGITAAHLATLGIKVAYVGAVGEDNFGTLFKSLLSNYDVCTDHLVVQPRLKTGVTVVMNKDEDRANITHAGAMASLKPKDITDELLKKSKRFHLSNPYVLPHFRNKLPDFYKHIKSIGTHTSLDPQWDVEEKWDTNLSTLLPYVDVFFPNAVELEKLLTGNQMSMKDLVNLSQNTIANTLGSEGVRLISNGQIKHYESFHNSNPIDCIGAGDAFTAGYLAALIENKSTAETIELACKNAALSTTIAGGTVPYISRQDFESMFEKTGL